MDEITNEFARLQALLSLDILDSPQEEQYDNITQLASDLFDVPIALVSLVDEKRQWFKSNCGLEGVSETSREVAFCHHAIQASDVMVVEDATKDVRFAQNPLVTGKPHIRFYAGAPLITKEGHALGTLCVIGHEPKVFRLKERKRLAQLAATIMGMIQSHDLTRKVFQLAESARKESEISRSIYNASEALILRLEAVRDSAGMVTDFDVLGANNTLKLIAGIAPVEIVNKRLLEVFPGLKDSEFYKFYVDAVDTGQSFTVESPYSSEGIEGWFRVVGAPCGEDGLTITSTPITDRKNFETTVRELKTISPLAGSDPTKYMEGLLELGRKNFGATDGFISEIRGDVYNIRSYIGNMEGVHAGGQMKLTDTICSIIAQEQRPIAFDDIQNAGAITHPCMPQNDFGSYIGAPIFVHGKFNGTISFVSDRPRINPFPNSELELLTIIASRIGHAMELESALEMLGDLNHELRTVLDNVPARIWYKDDNNKILRANVAAVRSVGLEDPRDVEGVQTEELFPELAAKYLADDKAVVDSGVAIRNIIESYAPTHGEEGWISTDKIPMTDHKGNRTILAVSTDITEIKRKEQQLSRLNESLSDFAFVASHDLQAPLRQSAMFAELFADELQTFDIELPGDSAEYLEEIQSGLGRMRGIVRSLYDLFKLDSENIDMQKIDLADVVSQARKQVTLEANGTTVEINVGDLFEYNVNFELMVQVIQNLIVNACKYGNKENLHINIYSEMNAIERRKMIIVEDNGVGVPLAFEKKIFEPFKRLHHSNDIEGAGIGLALCKKIMALHEGDLYLDSKYQDGARFVLSFNY
ncbi:GAF domain-containing protein [Hirschia litorea]|uniref:histidine kinase n=1 Tax=Hirschia litorea TaxID=1199156 RepID=A0ABW2II13_9PROT